MLDYIVKDDQYQTSFISWPQFLTYFFLGQNNEHQFFLSNKYFNLFREIFDSVTNISGNKVSTFDFVEKLLENEVIIGKASKIARKGNNSVPDETIEEVLIRIRDEAKSFIS